MADKLEGLELAGELDAIEHELFADKRAKVQRVLKGIYHDLASWTAEQKALEKRLADTTSRIAKAKEKLVAIRNGDWSQVPDWSKDANAPAKAGSPDGSIAG